MIYACVRDIYADYEIEDPEIIVDGYLGLLFDGTFRVAGTDAAVDGQIRVRSDLWWASSDSMPELEEFADGVVAALDGNPLVRAKFEGRR